LIPAVLGFGEDRCAFAANVKTSGIETLTGRGEPIGQSIDLLAAESKGIEGMEWYGEGGVQNEGREEE